ncbi:reticulon-like protein B12 [Triticum dicoccoides]|uniref:reticulon-like protein B12 n=1 Tax=Triticum dicoccoides TaxID=85692 RepID=UPI00188DDB47|nr:reticulon-like protein B12 [Triticum dicoccoides]
MVLWRRGRADLSALLLATVVASWILFHGASGYTAVSLAADMLFLLLVVLYAWSRAARLLGHPAPPIPDLQLVADELDALISSGLAGIVSAFRRVAQGQPGSGRVFA